MNCLGVREQLTEFALGTLPPEEARRVERHLEWCEGCRKEFALLQEGLTPVALSLAPVEPSPQLEERLVERILTAAGKWRTTSRRGIRALVGATLAAILVAAGALGWALAERHNVVDVKQQVADQLAEAKGLERLLRSGGATPFVATLRSASANDQSSGSVIVYSAPNVNNFILTQVVLSGPEAAPYRFELTDRRGSILSGGQLVKTNNGTWLFFERTRRNLSRGVSVLVLDRSGKAVLTGTMAKAPTK